MRKLLTDRRLLITAAGIGTLLAVALWPQTLLVDAVTTTRGTLTVDVTEEGRTRVRDRFVVSSPAAGRVLRVELEPGDRVHRGDVVARVQPAMPPLIDARAHAEARAIVNGARAALGRAEAEQRRTESVRAYTQRESERARRLAAEGVMAPQELDLREADARSAAEAAQAAAFAAQAAAAELQQAMARLNDPSSPLDARVVNVVSPADGVILRRLRESEAVVPAGEALVEIGDATDLEVVVDLLSSDAARIRPGARALITASRDDAPYAGHVRRIEPSGFTKISALGVEEQRVNVIVDVDTRGGEEDGVLGDGYRVDVAIVVRDIANALLVPTSALFRDGDRWAAFAIVDGRARLSLLDVGEQTPRLAQVMKGLDAGALVIAHPGERVVDGVRVRARP